MNTPDTRTSSRTLPAHCENPPRTLPAQSENTTSLKALARAALGASLQCADVRPLGNAQSHNTGENRTSSRTLPAHRGRVAPIADDELPRLVRVCGIAYQFTEAEHAEALQAALSDPESALVCFRQIAAEVSTGNPATTTR